MAIRFRMMAALGSCQWVVPRLQQWPTRQVCAAAHPSSRHSSASSSSQRPGPGARDPASSERNRSSGRMGGRGRGRGPAPAQRVVPSPPSTGPATDAWSAGVQVLEPTAPVTQQAAPAKPKPTHATSSACAPGPSPAAPSHQGAPIPKAGGQTGPPSSSVEQASLASASSQHEETFAAAVAVHALSQSQVQQLLTYLDYMLETNKVMNLTAVRDRQEALTRHLVDSLALLPVIDGLPGEEGAFSGPGVHVKGSSGGGLPLRVIDVGTGAGLPGMVLAIARPQWRVTLLDTLRKRCDFLQRAAQLAGVANVDVIWSRAEDGGRNPALRDAHDLAVARAVADARVLAELCLPYVRPGGHWVAAKGADPEAEVDAARQAIQKLGGSGVRVVRVQSFSPEGQRTALVVSKARSTPSAYPRSPGTPNKNPL